MKIFFHPPPLLEKAGSVPGNMFLAYNVVYVLIFSTLVPPPQNVHLPMPKPAYALVIQGWVQLFLMGGGGENNNNSHFP